MALPNGLTASPRDLPARCGLRAGHSDHCTCRDAEWGRPVAAPQQRAHAIAAMLLLLLLLLACTTERQKDPATTGPPSAGHLAAGSALKVQRVIDGDSLVLSDAGGLLHEVRIGAIDAPELRQPGGPQARRALRRLLRNQEVHLNAYKKDRYQRLVGNISVRGRDIGLQMVRRGHAWHFRRFAHEQPSRQRRAYERAEKSARNAGLGLWSNPRAQPPWQWRQAHRSPRRPG